MIDTVQFGRQVPVIESSLQSPTSTMNTEIVTFITHIHRNRLSPFCDAPDWSWAWLWAGRQRVLFPAGARY